MDTLLEPDPNEWINKTSNGGGYMVVSEDGK
jgi:hypothetical protein